MKKLLAFILVFTLVLGLGAVASATVSYEDSQEVEITKNLTASGTNPAETYTFTVGAGSGDRDGEAITAPPFTDTPFTIDFAQGATTGSAKINLPDFEQVGVYTYTITEDEGDTAGMRYDDGDYYLVVTVINDLDNDGGFLRVVTLKDANNLKEEAFQNSFEAGSLTVKKEVTGNYADPNDVFTVTVTLTPIGNKDLKAGPISHPGSTSFNQDSETGVVTITYTVKDGSAVTIDNIPYDVNYTVVETELVEGYEDPDYDEFASGEIKNPTQETTITNTRNIGIETGINLDSLPYLIILAVAIAGLAIFIVRRRMAVNE